MYQQIIAAGFSLLLLLPFKAVAADLNFDKLYVFGDSLSDIGNIYNITTRANLIRPGITPVDPPVRPTIKDVMPMVQTGWTI